VNKKVWILLALLGLLFAGLFAYGLSQGDAGYVFKNASENYCFS
jgi:hypothetical protein